MTTPLSTGDERHALYMEIGGYPDGCLTPRVKQLAHMVIALRKENARYRAALTAAVEGYDAYSKSPTDWDTKLDVGIETARACLEGR